MNTKKAIIKYYESTITDYKVLWSGSKAPAMHFGYYDTKAKHHKEAILRMNEFLANLIKIKSTDCVLDAGCGLGGSAVWLAQNIGCQVRGITIVPHQVAMAQKNIKKYNLEQKVIIQKADYTKTSFPQNFFDVVWAIESIVHAEKKQDFVKEAYRILKPKGKLLIAEYLLKNSSLSKEEKNLINPWLKGWAMPNLLTKKEYLSLLTRYGFKDITFYDISSHVKRSLRRLQILEKILYPLGVCLKYLRIFNQERFDNVIACRHSVIAFDRRIWRYQVITAIKN